MRRPLQISPRARRVALNRVVQDSLQPTAWALAALYLAYAIGHELLLPAPIAHALAATALATAAGLVGVALATATILAVIVHAARVRAHTRRAAMRSRDRARRRAPSETASALEQSEQRHRDLLEQGLGIVGTHDTSGTILSVNPAAARALGREAHEIVGHPLGSFVAPAYAPLLDAYLERILQDGRHAGVMRVVTSSGEHRLWDYHGALCEQSNRAPYALVHAHDITDRVRLEKSLRAAQFALEQRVIERTAELEVANAALRSEVDERGRMSERLLRYAQALEACSDAIALAALDGTIVDANAALLAMCARRDKAAVVGRNVLELLAPEDHARARADGANVIAGGPVTAREYRLLGPGGARTQIEATVGTIADDKQTRLGLVVVARDITERKRMETALRHNEAYLRTLIENSADAILVLDVDGTILGRPNGDPSTIGRFGFPHDKVVGRFATDFVHPEDRSGFVRAFVATTEAPLESKAIECRIRDDDGAWRAAEVTLRNLLHDPTVAGLMCTVRDLSAHKRAEEELRRAKDAAEAANQAKSEFLATMSHELRTPIHAILGYTELLQEGALGPILAEQADALKRIRDRANHQFELVSAVLDLSAIETGRMRVEARDVGLPELLRQIAAEGREAWSASGLELVWHTAEDLPTLSSDPAKLKLIVRHLVSNAVKFTSQGSVTIAARRAGGGVEIRVTDTGIGIGIPAEAHELIFEPFRQLDGSEARRYEGSGLGLHIVKRLLALLGGSITLQTEVGRGSTFAMWLPLRPRPDAGERPSPRETILTSSFAHHREEVP